MKDNEEFSESFSSGNSLAATRSISWHLWSPTQDLHKIKPVKMSAMEEGRVHKVTPRAEELSAAGWCLGKETHFLQECSYWQILHAFVDNLIFMLWTELTWPSGLRWIKMEDTKMGGRCDRESWGGPGGGVDMIKIHCTHAWNFQRINVKLFRISSSLKPSTFLWRPLPNLQDTF